MSTKFVQKRTKYNLYRTDGSKIGTFTIDCPANALESKKKGLAAEVAHKAGVSLADANLIDADLQRANLRNADLKGAFLVDANLRRANLRRANLQRANLRGAYFEGAYFEGANLRDANLSVADLRDANLQRANLRNAYLEGTNLRGANLRGTNLWDADFRGANLKESLLDEPIATEEQARQRLSVIAQNVKAEPNSLDMREWHACETTHCLAGWAIHHAGEEGARLEAKYGPYVAGLLLLGNEAASHFYDIDDAAKNWLKQFLPTAEERA